MMESNEVEQLFQEKGFQRQAKLINSDDLEFEITEIDSEKIRDTIGALNHNFKGRKKIRVKSVFNLSGRNNPGLHLSNCIFEENVLLNNSNSEFEQYFVNCEFRKGVNFTKAKFKNNVRFHRTKFFGKAEFTNTTFKKLVDFYFAEFIEDQQFHLTDFEGTTIFSNTTFHKSIQFLHNKVEPNSYISFENAVFYNGLDLSRSNFWCTVQFWGIDFSNTQIEKLHESELYQNDDFTGLEAQNSVRALSRIRETFRVIKHEFRKQGNNIHAQFFHRLEMKAYSVELKADSGRAGEKMLLLMNGLSNRHGQSWPRAFWFTMIVTGISYCIYLLTIQDDITIANSAEDVGYTIKYFFQLLNLTNWDYQPFGVSNEPEGYIILFINRLFIGYGYYQFIQSFRKYGKN